jgi:hypothetical protein
VVVSRYLAWLKAVRLWNGRANPKANSLVERAAARSVGALNRGLLVLDRDLRSASAAVWGHAERVGRNVRRPSSGGGRP